MAEFRPRRSMLFMPAANERALEKAKTLPCDGVVFDLAGHNFFNPGRYPRHTIIHISEIQHLLLPKNGDRLPLTNPTDK